MTNPELTKPRVIPLDLKARLTASGNLAAASDPEIRRIVAFAAQSLIVTQAGRTGTQARAKGGPVRKGTQYLVGEDGPELFTAGASGQITSNNRLASLRKNTFSSGSGTTDPRVIALLEQIAQNNPGINIDNLNVSAASGERADRTVPRALRRMSFELGA